MTSWTSALWACVAALCCTNVVAQGTTVAIGGAFQDDNHEVWRALADAVRGAGDEAACYSIITLASGEPARTGAAVATNLQRHGVRGVPLDAAASPDALSRCRGVFMTGGVQARLMDGLAPGGQDGPLLRAMRDLWRRGGVVAGTSAGAAVLSAVAFREAGDVLAVMQGRLREGHEWGRGFGFAPEGVVIDQHAVRRGRLGRMLPLMVAQRQPLGVAVEENSAVFFMGDSLQVLGARGALVADLQPAQTALDPLRVTGGRLHWLESGDRFNLSQRVVQASPRKQAGTRLQPLAPEHQPYLKGSWFYADMLGEGAVVAALTRLVDGNQRELRGLAFSTVNTPDAILGFEWRWWADPGTTGWLAFSPESYTVAGARFDIVPVRVQQPVYRPWP